MKRTLLLLATVAGSCLVCLAGSDAVGASAIVMKIGHSQPVDHPRQKSFLKFKETVESKTQGGIKVEIYPASQLGSEAEQMESVKMGVIQGTRGGSFEAATPKLLIYTMPFLFKDIASARKITRGSIGEKIAKESERNGIIILATGDAGGLRNFTNNARPLTKPDDMKGLKLRTPPIESIIKTVEALGANPVSLPYSEVYMALKTGVADGQENPYVNITAMKFQEVQKYLSVLNYQYHPDPFYVSLKWYQSLSPAFQAILKDASVEMMRYNDELVDTETDTSFKLLKVAMKVNELTEAERKPFIEKVDKVYDFYINTKKLFGKDELEQIRRVASQ